MEKTKIVCLLGESGSGKTTIANKLSELGLKNIESFTTRKPRYENEQGHIFTTKKQYDCNKANCSIAAETLFNGEYYWTTKGQLSEDCVYIIDKKGVDYLRENLKDKEIIVIYLKTDKKNRYIRMLGRGDDSDTALERIDHDLRAFEGVDNLEYSDYVVNGNRPLTVVLEDVKKILKNRGIL